MELLRSFNKTDEWCRRQQQEEKRQSFSQLNSENRTLPLLLLLLLLPASAVLMLFASSVLRRLPRVGSGSAPRCLLSYNSRIDPAATIIQKSQNLKEKTPYNELVFGHTFTDHMLEVDWNTVREYMLWRGNDSAIKSWKDLFHIY